MSSITFIFGITAGIFCMMATVLIIYAMSFGVAGPASALTNMCSVTQIILDLIFLGQSINSMQGLGMTLGIIGAITLAVG